jgi:hypothetical protein
VTTELVAALAAGTATILASVFAMLKWMISKFLIELKPNSGSSIKDQVSRLEIRVDDIYQILAERSKND